MPLKSSIRIKIIPICLISFVVTRLSSHGSLSVSSRSSFIRAPRWTGGPGLAPGFILSVLYF